MHILGISHIGIAAKDPDKARHFFGEVLGLPCVGEEVVTEQKTHTTTFASAADAPMGAPSLELLQARPASEGPIAGFLAKRGGGVHHMALRVADLAAALSELRALNVRLIDETPRLGANHTRVAFIHPEATGGVLVELVEERSM